ncbi:MAG: hypothetical protein RRY76_01735 [Clostridia bacterium]
MKNKLFELTDLYLNSHDFMLIGIDGNSGAGKSTLSRELLSKYDCNLFRTDDFFLPPERKTILRLDEIGGNVDYERINSDVILPLLRREPFVYKAFDCRCNQQGDDIFVPVKKLNIIEGVYSLHPFFKNVFSLRVLMRCDKNTQLARITARNGTELAERYRREWIPLEDKYLCTLKYFDVFIETTYD